jgi:hypothetical protein
MIEPVLSDLSDQKCFEFDNASFCSEVNQGFHNIAIPLGLSTSLDPQVCHTYISLFVRSQNLGSKLHFHLQWIALMNSFQKLFFRIYWVNIHVINKEIKA